MPHLTSKATSALALAATLAGSAAYAASAATAAQVPAAAKAGEITVFVPLNAKTRAPALVIGAIGDHGTFVSIDRNGTPDANGNYAKLIMTRGSFELDGRAFTRALRPIAKPNLGSCTISFAGAASISVFNGTGAYKGIHGTLHGVGRAGLLAARDANGQCDHHANPVEILGSITATGNVTY